MKCEELRQQLDDYVDGALSEPLQREAEEHLEQCAACRTELEGLQALVSEAAGVRADRAPERDLWPEIAARLGSRGRVLAFPGPSSQRWPWRRLLASASVAATLLVALGVLWMHGRTNDDGNTWYAGTVDEGLAREIKAAEADFAEAREELLAVLASRRGNLSSETMAVVDENLAVIEQAVNEIHAAIAEDPGSPHLVAMLYSTHQQELEFLNQVVHLSDGS